MAPDGESTKSASAALHSYTYLSLDSGPTERSLYCRRLRIRACNSRSALHRLSLDSSTRSYSGPKMRRSSSDLRFQTNPNTRAPTSRITIRITIQIQGFTELTIP